MEGKGQFQFSDPFTELPVPPQAAGVVGSFNVLLLYIILNTTYSIRICNNRIMVDCNDQL